MIIAGKSQSQKPKISPIGTRPSKAGYLPAAYEIGKTIVKSYGYYKDIEPYLPDKYIDKYTYKPHKRITGYLGQTFHSKKTKNVFSYQFNQEYARRCRSGNYYNTNCHNSNY